MIVGWWFGCADPAEPCACSGGHGVTLCAECPCQCLANAAETTDPVPATVRYVDADASHRDGTETMPWATVDWAVLDADVVGGDVLVVFDAGDMFPDRLDVARTDTGPHRVVLHGNERRRMPDGTWAAAGAQRAIVPGVSTGFDDVERSRITVRGFDVTGSSDKGIYWRAGDEIVIEDNLVHANRGTPALSLDYTSRTGHRASSFVVRNNHVWDQLGECIYIGGAEGFDLDSHEGVVIENNLVHGCSHPFSAKHDGINVKDRITDLSVVRNVVFETNWGIELASPGEIRGNLVFATRSNGVHATDGWGLGMSGAVFEDNVILGAGDAGMYLNASHHPWAGVILRGLTIVGANGAAVEAGGEAGIEGTLDQVVIADCGVGLDAWSPMDLEVSACTVHDTEPAGDRELAGAAAVCEASDPGLGDLAAPAGPDGWFFTDDDPWVSPVGGAQPVSSAR